VTLMIIAAGFALFGLAVKYLPIFPEEKHAGERRMRAGVRPVAAQPVLGHAGD